MGLATPTEAGAMGAVGALALAAFNRTLTWPLLYQGMASTMRIGIDLVWFGVLICANIQTSFMHPPFGFALFYLRGIAPRSVKTADIYWGAIPWIGTMVVLVAIVIFWPESVTYWIDKSTNVDPAKVRIDLPALDAHGPIQFGPAPPRR